VGAYSSAASSGKQPKPAPKICDSHASDLMIVYNSYKLQFSTLFLGSGIYGEHQAGPNHKTSVPRLCSGAPAYPLRC
jgi:hypothetical protein